MQIQEALAEFIAARRAAGLAVRTLDWYEDQISLFVRWLEAENINGTAWLRPEVIEAFLNHERDRGLSPSTVNARYRALNPFFKWLKKRGKLGVFAVPTEAVDRPRVPRKAPRRAKQRDVVRLLNSIDAGTWIGLRDRAIITLMFSTGLRREEVVLLDYDDVDMLEKFVLVRQGKGMKERSVPFGGELAKAITLYLMNRPPSDENRLFISATGNLSARGPMTGNAIRLLLKRRCAAGGVDYINAHSLRHLFATKALNDGIDISAVSAMLGHESEAFTAKVYAPWLTEGLRREYDRYWRES